MIEKWETVENTDGFYKVSDKGNVYSTRNDINLKIHINHRGYKYVNLSVNNKVKYWTIHKLVATHFIDRDGSLDLQVNHIDGVKTNNTLSNLEWCTRQENIDHAGKIGLQNRAAGSKNGNSKLNEMEVLTIKTLLGIKTNKELAKHYNVDPVTISDIKHGKSWYWMNVDFKNNYKS